MIPPRPPRSTLPSKIHRGCWRCQRARTGRRMWQKPPARTSTPYRVSVGHSSPCGMARRECT